MDNMTINDLKNTEGVIAGFHTFLVKGCAALSRRNSEQKYISGMLCDKQGEIPYKIWDAKLVSKVLADSIDGKVITATLKVSEYNGVKETAILDFTINEDVDKSMFQKSCDVTDVLNRFNAVVSDKISDRGKRIISLVIQKDIKTKFIKAQAASFNHDAILGGLVSHTTKCMELMAKVCEQHNFDTDIQDLLMLGVLFHDIGKIYEMDEGVYTDISFVTHRILGIEILHTVKDKIVELYDKLFYYHLIAILQGHHGDYEDPCRTIYCKVVHCVDMLETWSTLMDENMENRQDIRDNKVTSRNLKF